jgi:hypothetical protein
LSSYCQSKDFPVSISNQTRFNTMPHIDDAAHDKKCLNSGFISLAPGFFLASRPRMLDIKKRSQNGPNSRLADLSQISPNSR